MKRLWTSPFLWLFVLALSAVGVFAATETWSNSSRLQKYGPHLAASLFSAVLTLVIVERVVRLRRQRDLAPVRFVALGRLFETLKKVIRLLAEMYKASAPAGSDKPADVDALLDGWVNEVQRLDFLREARHRHGPGPGDEAINWLAYTSDIASEIDASLKEVVDLYAEALGSELVVGIELLLHSPVFDFLRRGRTHPYGSGVHEDYDPYLALASRQSLHFREAFAWNTQRLLAEFAQRMPHGVKYPSLEVFWRDDVVPLWGQSRYEGPLIDRLTEVVVMGPTDLPPAGPEQAGRIYRA